MTTSAGDFLSQLLKPIKRAVEYTADDEYDRELFATSINDQHYNVYGEGKQSQEEFYDMAFVFSAHPVDVDGMTKIPYSKAVYGIDTVKTMFSRMCVFRSTRKLKQDFPQSQYSFAFHANKKPTLISRLASTTSKAINRVAQSTPGLTSTIELATYRDRDESPPLIEVQHNEFVVAGFETLSPFYCLENIFLQSQKCKWRDVDLQLFCRTIFLDCLDRLGVLMRCQVLEDKYIVSMRLSEGASLETADFLHYPVRLRREYGGGNVEFSKSMDRRALVHYDGLAREMVREEDFVQGTIFRDVDRCRLLMLQVQAHFNLDQTLGLRDYFALHRVQAQQYLVDSFRDICRFDSLRMNYFGKEIGCYFAWMLMLNTMLIWPVVLGLLIYMITKFASFGNDSMEEGEYAYGPLPEYSVLIISFGYMVVLSCWHERLIHQSGLIVSPTHETSTGVKLALTPTSQMSSSEDELMGDKHGTRQANVELERFDYQFDCYRLDQSGHYVKYENLSERRSKRVLGFLLTIWMHLSLIGGFAFTFYLRVQPNLPYLNTLNWINYFQTALIFGFDKLWAHVIFHIMRFENHRYEADYRKSLVRKSATFKFVNHFLPLLYSVLIRTGDSTTIADRFRGQLLTQVITFVASDVVEIVLLIVTQLQTFRSRKLKTGNSNMSIQLDLPSYDVTKLTQNFLDILIQLTHILFFAPICPTVPLLAAVRCVLQLYTQNFKLAALYKRTVTHSSPTSLVPLMQLAGNLATPVGLALVLYAYPTPNFKQKLLTFVVLEHLLFGVRYATRALSDIAT